MEIALNFLLEIVKIALPALIVAWVVRNMLQQHFDQQKQIKLLAIKEGNQQVSLPLKLQAYERLAMFLERISVPSLVLRLRTSSMTVNQLRISMLLAVQQEFEHNITQQVYVSEQLWQIIKLAKDFTSDAIDRLAEGFEAEEPALVYSNALLEYWNEQETRPTDKALQAVKKEAGTLM